MHREWMARRSFLLSALAAVGGGLLAGCADASKDVEVTKQEDPSIKAKESMDFYKNSMLKLIAL